MQKQSSGRTALAALLVVAVGWLAPAWARGDTFGVKAVALSFFNTDPVTNPGGAPAGTCNGVPGFPACFISVTNTGLTTAYSSVGESGTTAANANPPLKESGSFADVTVSEGHVGLSAEADTTGIGTAQGYAEGTWNDVMTVGAGTSGLARGTDVQLVATLGMDADFSGLGLGSSEADGCFSDESTRLFKICTNGSDGTSSGLVEPATVTETFTGWVGEVINIQGSAEADASADSYHNADKPAVWNVVATNSAHFTITPTEPSLGLDLTLESGCSITTGYGCDPVPTGDGGAVPEPPSWTLLAAGLLAGGGAWEARRRHAPGRN